jgi:hypothetical protein
MTCDCERGNGGGEGKEAETSRWISGGFVSRKCVSFGVDGGGGVDV